jgi:hypothetical protein
LPRDLKAGLREAAMDTSLALYELCASPHNDLPFDPLRIATQNHDNDYHATNICEVPPKRVAGGRIDWRHGVLAADVVERSATRGGRFDAGGIPE